MVTFVLETYALVTFVHKSNISAVTGLILTKLFGLNFFRLKFFSSPNIFLGAQNFTGPKKFQINSFFRLKFFSSPNIFLGAQNFTGP